MAISPLTQGGGFPFATGFGPTSTPGGFSNSSFGFPGVQGFGFPPPFVDPFMFFAPAASSFNINRLLGAANGTAVPINIGPTPSTLGISPFIMGFPFFGGGAPGTQPPAAPSPFLQGGGFSQGAQQGPFGGTQYSPFPTFGGSPFTPFGGLGQQSMFGVFNGGAQGFGDTGLISGGGAPAPAAQAPLDPSALINLLTTLLSSLNGGSTTTTP